MALKIFIILFWVCRTFHPTIWHYGILPENFLTVKKKNFLYFAWGAILTKEVICCSLKPNCNHMVLIIEVTSKLIERLSSYNQRNKLTNWVTMFWNFLYNIHCVCCYGIESANLQPKMYCYQLLEMHCV